MQRGTIVVTQGKTQGETEKDKGKDTKRDIQRETDGETEKSPNRDIEIGTKGYRHSHICKRRWAAVPQLGRNPFHSNRFF